MNHWEHLSITLKNSLKLDIIQMLESFVDNSEAVWRWVIRAYHDTYTNFKHSISQETAKLLDTFILILP